MVFLTFPGIITPAGAGIAQENITIQNNRFLNNDEEGVVFFYGPAIRRRSTPSAS
jgi:hypothetical protein